ncbi:MAG: ribonuclease H-like domain-containing protein, partial [Rhodanobacteraceae bacterium]
MSVTVARLAALKRETGTRCALPALMATRVQQKPADTHPLRQLLRLHEARGGTHVARSGDRALPGEEIAPGLRLVQARLPAEALGTTLDGAFDRRDDFDPARVLFFDTETTGLAGGSGTRAFMIGAAQWRDGVLEVRQLTITTLAAERAMLDEFARWLRPDTILASYNGKSYDAPLLRTRYRL